MIARLTLITSSTPRPLATSLSATAQLQVAVETSTDLGTWGAVTAGSGGVTEEKTELDAQHEHVKLTIR